MIKNIKKMPLVTLIVAMYKGEKYINECIDSIINQDYSNIEIILVDDGSPDACGDIAENYKKKDNRIKVLHQKNQGVSSARNNAIDMATGEYICIIDQDDCISKDYVSYFYKLIVENNADIALTWQPKIFYDKIENSSKEPDRIKILTASEVTTAMLYHKIVIAPWNKMISKKLSDTYKIRFNPDFFGGEGFAFSIDCYQRAERIAVGQRKVYYYRVGDPESGASKFRKTTIDSSISAQLYIRDNLVNPTKEELVAWEFSNWHTYCDCLNIMVGCKVTKEYSELYRKIREKCKKEALCALKAPISKQQKLRGILFRISPYMAAKIINHFRIRKFDSKGQK